MDPHDRDDMADERIHSTANVEHIEAPITVKAYLMCAFAAFGGFFFGFDSGYISGVLNMKYFIHTFQGLPYPPTNATPAQESNFIMSANNTSLIVSILSAGTFFGSILSGSIADWIGPRTTIISGCIIFCAGVVIEVASHTVPVLAVGRLVAGFGFGFVSAIIILYMSEVAPRKVRGMIVSGYQLCIEIGMLIANCVNYGTKDLLNSGSYRIPMSIQFIPAVILGVGLFLLPESPRYFVKKGKIREAALALALVRGQPHDSEYVQYELAEVIANYEYELSITPQGSYWSSWTNCFKGGLFTKNSNLHRTILGTSLQMMQQWTGINFIMYYSTIFLQSLGTVKNPFLMSLVFSIMLIIGTPVTFYLIEHYGRRAILIYGALGMLICEFIIAGVGTALPTNKQATEAVIVFICFYVVIFSATWGPAAWVIIGEIFSIPIRARGVALSTASNWLWNTIIGLITPVLVNKDRDNLGAKVFFLWGSLCTVAMVYAWLLIPETKGLSLEQVDRMFEETVPWTSAKWKPHSTFAEDLGLKRIGSGTEADAIERVADSTGRQPETTVVQSKVEG